MTLDSFFQNLANGISLGSLYALIAIGYTMVYGILRLINFAHGDLVMLGAYFAFYGVSMFFLPWWAAFIFGIGVTAGIGVIMEKVAYRPLREYPRINLFTAAVAVSFLLENLAIVIFGGRPNAFNRPAFLDQMLNIGSVSFVSYTPIIIAVSVVLFIGLMLIINKTKAGMALGRYRRTSKQPD